MTETFKKVFEWISVKKVACYHEASEGYNVSISPIQEWYMDTPRLHVEVSFKDYVPDEPEEWRDAEGYWSDEDYMDYEFDEIVKVLCEQYCLVDLADVIPQILDILIKGDTIQWHFDD